MFGELFHSRPDAGPPIVLSEMIAEVRREIEVREKVYPAWVRDKRLTEKLAARRIAVLRAVLTRLLREVANNGNAK